MFMLAVLDPLIGFAGAVLCALIAALAPFIRAATKSIIERTKQPLPSAQDVLVQARRFALPIFTLGIAVTALLLSLRKPAFPKFSFEEQHDTAENKTNLVLRVPEGQVAKVILVGFASVASDYDNNHKTQHFDHEGHPDHPNDFRFGVTISITDERGRTIGHDTQWMPMFVNCHNKEITPFEDPDERPKTFVPCGVGTIPISRSVSATVTLNSGEHIFYAKADGADTQLPIYVTLSYLAAIREVPK
jgi:hypothetical protein